MPHVRRAMAAPLALLVLLVAAAGAFAAPGQRYRDTKPAPDFDVRARTGASPHVDGPKTAAQRRFGGSLGTGGTLGVDRVTGTVRTLTDTSGSLTGKSSAAPGAVVERYARAHAAALGLDAGDVDALGSAQVTDAGRISTVRFRQSVDGIPAYDSELRGAVDRDGRLLTLGGAPAPDLKANTTTPSITAHQAERVLASSVGVTAVPDVDSVADGARRKTAFANGDMGRLVLFVDGDGAATLAWHVTLTARKGMWSGVVDATSGRLLRRQDLVDAAANTPVYPRYPGYDGPDAGTAPDAPVTVDLEARGWLSPGTNTLDGPFSRAYSDVDASDSPSAREEVRRTSANAFDYPLTPFPGNDEVEFPGQCPAATPCTWDDLDPTSWKVNRAEATIQSFAYVSNFHDHLAAPPIGFDAGSGAFEDDDPVITESDDGAATGLDGGPADDFLNNANMGTPPDGQSPRMQMYLGSIHQNGLEGLFRNNNNGEDAATVYHEYTHGLTNRLVTTADGDGALDGQQAGSMGEAWSDWYTFDYLNAAGLSNDTTAPGEQDLGAFTDYTPNSVRTQPLDCPVLEGGADDPANAALVAACPGTSGFVDPGAGPGGYTFADFGKILGFPEVHSDGEIWAETLWDLREAIGSQKAEAVVTGGLRLSPPNPSFLDERNAILVTAQDLYDQATVDTLWSVFAKRGMGYFASTSGSNDTEPVADFATPPPANTPKGTVSGRVTDQDTGAALSGVTVGVGGLNTAGLPGGSAGATTGADGRYAFQAFAHTYRSVTFEKGGGYFPASVSGVPVTSGATTTRNATMRRTIAYDKPVSANNDTGAEYACGVNNLDDANVGSVWEIDRTQREPEPPVATIDLGSVQAIGAYGLDPSEGCGSGPDSATKGYKLESSLDGRTWTTVKQGSFAEADTHRLNEVKAPAGAASARYVRLTLLSPQDPNTQYWDFAELAVFTRTGSVTPTPTPTAGPTASPSPTPTPPVKPAVKELKPKRATARARIVCETRCTLRAQLLVSKKTRKRGGLKRRTIIDVTRTFTGTRTLQATIGKKTRKRLRKRVGKTITVTLKLTAKATGGPTTRRTYKVRLRL